MKISSLHIQYFRNLSNIRIEPQAGFNVFYGRNGSGKTSLLESIYLLGLGRSFRTNLLNKAIQYGLPGFSLFGLLTDLIGTNIPVGLEKSQSHKTKIKIHGEHVESISELVSLLPLQLINADTFQLIDSGPQYRRRFLDWMVFHVEPRFFSLWKRMQRALKQRNAALRTGCSLAQIQAWDEEFVTTSLSIEAFRQDYFKKWIPIFEMILSQLIDLPQLSIQYKQGWNEHIELAALLIGGISRDREQGSTQLGPQRSNFIIKMNQIPVEHVLSRGEQKLLVCAMHLSQGVFLSQYSGKNSVYLLDDICAELDEVHCSRVFALLSELQSQVFISGTDSTVFSKLEGVTDAKLFHVKQGQIA